MSGPAGRESVDCGSTPTLISAQLDGEIDAGAAGALADHLRACPRCAALAARHESLHRAVRIRAAEAVPDLTAPILARALRRPGQPTRTKVLAVAAAVAVAVMGVAAVLATALTTERADPALAAELAVAPEPLGGTGVVYLTLTNDGGDDALVRAWTDVASSVDLHTVISDEGRLVMRSADHLDCSPGLTQDAATSHLMLVGIRRPLRPGDEFPLTLEFERSGTMTVVVSVVDWGSLPDLLPDR
jgi:periplasmic copper chaperone A